MDQRGALVGAAILALGITRALVRGDAAAGEGIRREDEPLTYWGIVGAASVCLVLLLIVAWRA